MATDLTEMASFSSSNHGVKYLLCVIDLFTKYAWVKPLTKEKAKAVLDGFISFISNLNQINYGLMKEDNFIITLCKKWLGDNDVLMYLTYNESNSVVAERFIGTLKSKTNEKMATNDNKSILVIWISYYMNTIIVIINLLLKPINADYSDLPQEFVSSHKAPKFEVRIFCKYF